MVLYYGDEIAGIHLTDIPFVHGFEKPHDLDEEENNYLEASKNWQMKEGGYNMVQSTKPQTLAYGLNDSPVGLAGWLLEKFQSLSDDDGKIENCFTKDELLMNITIYWVTQTINSSARLYYETMKTTMNAIYNPLMKINPFDKTGSRSKVPAAFAFFPKGLIAPQQYADRFFNIQHWTIMPKGGHFAAMEQPELLAMDIKKFGASLGF